MPDIPLRADSTAGIEYIKAMLDYARDDARHVYLRVTAALALAVLVLTQLPFRELQALETLPKIAFCGGLSALVLAAVFHHGYLQEIHHTRRAIAQCLPTVNARAASRLGPPTWNRQLWRLRLGDAVLGAGALLLAAVIVVLLA